MIEFVILMAYLTALVALSIDAILPALGLMGGDLHVIEPNHVQYVVGFIFVGMTLGQLIYGPLSDSIGRKPALFIGIALYIVGCILSWLASALPLMLLGRFVQGLGVAAPRILTMAVTRDKFHGREMAKIMSMIMGVFIMVPAIAPSIGQGIMHVVGWRKIFLFYIAAALSAGTWAYFRLPESLPVEKRREFKPRILWSALKEAATNRTTVGYTICSGLLFSSLLAYLNSAQQIFQDIFNAGDKFAMYFGMLALAIGAAFFTNSALVERYGMRPITTISCVVVILASIVFMGYNLYTEPTLLGFMIFMAISFFCLGLTFGNMGAMALEPMGHIAGMATALMGSASTAISIAIGVTIGQLYDGTLLPMAGGFLTLSTAAFFVIIWIERGIKSAFTPHSD
ncbi:MAG: multidrug effflux MFS transporter [Alphaproteobacteria bacterium]|nr:multidrug effflux MFS transporter [Alphaproteobacteria bacterium]